MTSPLPPTDDRPTVSRNARYGMILFIAYVIFYAGFVAIAAFSFDSMRTEFGGVNLAIIYGMALILMAFVLSIIYMFICGNEGGE